MRFVQRPALDRRHELVDLDVVVERQRREVAPLLAPAETIDDEDPADAALVERPHHGAADEARPAGDDCEAVVSHAGSSTDLITRPSCIASKASRHPGNGAFSPTISFAWVTPRSIRWMTRSHTG